MKEIARYLFEIGSLKRIPRSGWQTAGIKSPETVAEHSFRTAIIGYILAKIEGADARFVSLICLFHDTIESRILDLHRLAKKYLEVSDTVEQNVIRDQIRNLPEPIKSEISNIFMEYQTQDTIEGKIAHDADKLDMLLQAIEYKNAGYHVDEWITSAIESLYLNTSKELAKAILSISPDSWYSQI